MVCSYFVINSVFSLETVGKDEQCGPSSKIPGLHGYIIQCVSCGTGVNFTQC